MDLDKVFGIHATALKIRAERMNVIANNIANGDTPGFKAKDLDFKEILAGLSPQQISMQATNIRHIAPNTTAVSYEVKFRQNLQPSADGNTVDPDVEKVKFSENAVQYQASMDFLGSKIKNILRAIKGE